MGTISKEEGTRPRSKRNKLQFTKARRLRDTDLGLQHVMPIQGCACRWLIMLILSALPSLVTGSRCLKLSFSALRSWDNTNISAWVHLRNLQLCGVIPFLASYTNISKGFESQVMFVTPAVLCRDKRGTGKVAITKF